MLFQNPPSYRVWIKWMSIDLQDGVWVRTCPRDGLEGNEDSKASSSLALDTSGSVNSWMVRGRQQTFSVVDSSQVQEQNQCPALAVLSYA